VKSQTGISFFFARTSSALCMFVWTSLSENKQWRSAPAMKLIFDSFGQFFFDKCALKLVSFVLQK
jgi:hypothetical protein